MFSPSKSTIEAIKKQSPWTAQSVVFFVQPSSNGQLFATFHDDAEIVGKLLGLPIGDELDLTTRERARLVTWGGCPSESERLLRKIVAAGYRVIVAEYSAAVAA